MKPKKKVRNVSGSASFSVIFVNLFLQMSDYARNKKAFFNYEILEKFEAGLELRGYEVKAIRKGSLDLSGSFVIVRGGEAYLVNTYITPFQPSNTPVGYDPSRARKLLLHKRELHKLAAVLEEKRLTVVPLRMYNKGDKIKVEIGIARGKRQYEKREGMKRREAEREIDKGIKT